MSNTGDEQKQLKVIMAERDRLLVLAKAAAANASAAEAARWCPLPLRWLGTRRCRDAMVHREVAVIYRHYAGALALCDGVDENIGWMHAPLEWVNVERCRAVMAAFTDFHAARGVHDRVAGDWRQDGRCVGGTGS
jgi:hypothetical protein